MAKNKVIFRAGEIDMRDGTFGRRRLYIYPLLSEPLTISIGTAILVLSLVLVGYALRALTDKK